MPGSVAVTAPSRLHFGLFALEKDSGGRRFGGVGAMIERPGLELVVRTAPGCSASGPGAERAAQVARRVHESRNRKGELNCHLEVMRSAPLHVGLGTGTQLALAVAAGLAALEEDVSQAARPSAEQLAEWTGRGRRSAVGAHGFAHGGLIVEAGKQTAESLSPLAERVEIPTAWRFVLVRPRGARGISGTQEEAAFAALAGPRPHESDAAREEALERLVPAVRAGEFIAACESLHRFCRHAGEIFAAWQGGLYASARLAQLIAALHDAGYQGVGQSSWGPTLFALVESHEQAQACLAMLRGRPDASELDLDIAAPCNTGARIEMLAH